MKKVVEIRRGELVPDEAKWLRDFTKREKDGERYQVRSGDGGILLSAGLCRSYLRRI